MVVIRTSRRNLLDLVFADVAVAAVGLNGGVGRSIPGFGGTKFGDGALGLQLLLSGVQPVGDVLDIGARRAEADRVRDEQLVGIGLLGRERAAGSDALLRIGHRALQSGLSAAQAEGRDHEARVAEHRLRLREPLALDAADDVLGRDLDVLERERRGVGDANAVLVLGLSGGESLGALLHDEEGGAGFGGGEDGVEIGVGAIGDELLAAVDSVEGLPVALESDRLALERAQVAAHRGLGDAVGHQERLAGDAAHPLALLLRRAADDDGVEAQRDRQECGREPQVDAGHRLADAIDLVGPAAHAAELLRDVDEVEANLGHQLMDDLLRKLLGHVRFQAPAQRHGARGELMEALEHGVQRFRGDGTLSHECRTS